ncbi:maker125 [Drosophila busckii]|uniref:Maker125 n=1 Tax=Drosophila busckii TaxID=30019 RepID=A0A0M4ELP2_DROBS|nr:uncharacterized protein LOC108595807 [Drosophila busckii]ALC42530.1 maker125 [Drosophila busckii]
MCECYCTRYCCLKLRHKCLFFGYFNFTLSLLLLSYFVIVWQTPLERRMFFWIAFTYTFDFRDALLIVLIILDVVYLASGVLLIVGVYMDKKLIILLGIILCNPFAVVFLPSITVSPEFSIIFTALHILFLNASVRYYQAIRKQTAPFELC